MFFLFGLASLVLATQSVTLAWDPSQDPEVTRIVVYYGHTSRNYASQMTVGNVTNATVTGLLEGLTYYFAVTATNSSGLESDFSNKVTNSIPANATNKLAAISTLADRVTIEDTIVGPLSFQVMDAEAVAASLTVSACSTKTVLVPNGNLVLGGSGSNRTLTVRPATNSMGRTLVTVLVGDGTKASSTSFPAVNASTNTYYHRPRMHLTGAYPADDSRATTKCLQMPWHRSWHR